ncbi:hypothetical protein ACFLUV_02140 [Elusimicrobiota bacterium]
MGRKKVIIGIHGVRNKPPKKVLAEWWKRSIYEGFGTAGIPRRNFEFELVYWADYLNTKPQDPGIKDKKNPQYVREPYVPAESAVKSDKPRMIKKKIVEYFESNLCKIFFKREALVNYDSIADFLIRDFCRELDMYYHGNCTGRKKGNSVKKELREELIGVIRRHRKKDILFIAHSMGGIIAFDVLSREIPDIGIHTFVTLGSPLGLPVIRKRILMEQGKEYEKEMNIHTPESITKQWFNFADWHDRVAVIHDLSDKYIENSHQVKPVDRVVDNNYKYKLGSNHHKIYGYLRTPELAEAINNFLEGKKPDLWSAVISIFKKLPVERLGKRS